MINRFEWLKAVLQAEVTDRAKVLASALAIQFGNDQTGQINPSIDTLCTYLRMSDDTVRRAISDLSSAGWLGRTMGRGRGNRSVYVLLSPGSVVALRPVQKVEEAPANRSHGCEVKPERKGRTAAAKRSQNCTPPYKAEQSSEQKAGARPAPHLAVTVECGGWQALEWNKWLSDQGLRTDLASLQALHVAGGYCLPWKTPPRPYQETDTRIALRIIEWAKSKGPGHVHAA